MAASCLRRSGQVQTHGLTHARSQTLFTLLAYPTEPARRSVLLRVQLNAPTALLSTNIGIDPPKASEVKDRHQRPLRTDEHSRRQLLGQRLDHGDIARRFDSVQRSSVSAPALTIIVKQLAKQSPLLPRHQGTELGGTLIARALTFRCRNCNLFRIGSCRSKSDNS